jgi:signal transduction histidine kinase
MLRLFSIQAKEKGVTLAISEDLLPPMMGDETKLSWALSNLIANAIRYTPRAAACASRPWHGTTG